MQMKLRHTVTVLAAAATLSLTGLSGTASAAAPGDTYAKGATRVAVSPAVADLLSDAGITPTATGPAVLIPFGGTAALRFPISVVAGGGTKVWHTGGVKLAKGSAKIRLSQFRINVNHAVVSAKVNGGARANVFKIRPTSRPRLGDVKLVLTGTAAGALNATFGVSAFAAGGTFGFAKVNPK